MNWPVLRIPHNITFLLAFKKGRTSLGRERARSVNGRDLARRSTAMLRMPDLNHALKLMRLVLRWVIHRK
jgi:hypothetical protein